MAKYKLLTLTAVAIGFLPSSAQAAVSKETPLTATKVVDGGSLRSLVGFTPKKTRLISTLKITGKKRGKIMVIATRCQSTSGDCRGKSVKRRYLIKPTPRTVKLKKSFGPSQRVMVYVLSGSAVVAVQSLSFDESDLPAPPPSENDSSASDQGGTDTFATTPEAASRPDGDQVCVAQQQSGCRRWRSEQTTGAFAGDGLAPGGKLIWESARDQASWPQVGNSFRGTVSLDIYAERATTIRLTATACGDPRLTICIDQEHKETITLSAGRNLLSRTYLFSLTREPTSSYVMLEDEGYSAIAYRRNVFK